MKTKTKNPINFMRRWGIMVAIVLIVAIATFSQWGGNPIGTANSRANLLMVTTNDISSEVVPNDEQAAKNYVLNVEQLRYQFERAYQSARVSNLDINTGADYLMKMNVTYEKFKGLEYSPNNPMVMELKQLGASWMEKRMNYISKLIMESAHANDYSSLAALEEGNAVYIKFLEQLNRAKTYYSI